MNAGMSRKGVSIVICCVVFAALPSLKVKNFLLKGCDYEVGLLRGKSKNLIDQLHNETLQRIYSVV